MNRWESVYRSSPVYIQTGLLNLHAYSIELHRYGRSCDNALAALLRSQHWDREAIRAFQMERLRVIVDAAYRGSRYYREVMDREGLGPADIRTLDDIRKLPLLTKEVVRNRQADLMTRSRPRRSWRNGHTSGTTGSPLSIWYDRRTCVATNAVDLRHKRWAGMTPGDWIGLILGRVVVPVRQDSPPYWRVNHVQRQVWFSAFHMSESTLDAYEAEIRRRKLRFLEGYPSTLFVLARHLLDRGRTLPMKSVITSSETLHSVQRAAIEEAFECRLFDFYAMAERVLHAGECEFHEGKHVSEEFGLLEVVDGNGDPVSDGQAGYLVGTSLHNRAMPMIRYRMGDVSSVVGERCACGRPSRQIQPVTTKAEDIIVTPEGRTMSPSVLTHPFKPLHDVTESQIVQDQIDHVLVRVVCRSGFSREERSQLVGALQNRLGPSMTVDVEQVDRIPRESSGKFRWVVSRVDHPYLFQWEEAS